MRLRLVVKRHELPDTALLWAVDEIQNPTISQVLDQINEVIPLESGGEWGLEEYVVELKAGSGSFECLHYMPVKNILHEDDEVVVRPLSSREKKQRRDAGRDQITQDGRHIIDGVAFGGTKRRAITGRPPVVIPSRKRARITYPEDEDAESDEGRAAKALRITQYPHSDEASPSRSGRRQSTEDDDGDSDEEDFVPQTQDDNEDDDFPVDPSEIDEELDALMEEAGTSDKENEQVAVPILLDEEIDTHGHPEIPLEELQLAFPDYPSKVLEHFLSVPNPKIGAIYNALAVGAVAKKPKTAVIRAIKRRIIELSMKDSKSVAVKETKKKEQPRPAKEIETAVPDTAADEDDDEEDEDHEEENPDDNGGVFTHGSIDPTGKLADAGAKHVRFEVSDDSDADDDDFDLDTDSSSSSSSDSDSDDETAAAPAKNAAPPTVDSDTSSSGSSSESDSDTDSSSESSSDSSSDSDSSSESDSDSDNEPEQQSSKVTPKATPLNAQTPIPAVKTAEKPATTVPPGEGRKSTKARNQRRRSQNVLQRLQNKGILPAGVTLTEFMKLDGVNDNTTPEDGAAAVAALRAEGGNDKGAETKKKGKEAKQAELQAARERMIAQLYSGGIDVTAGGEQSAHPATATVPAEEKRKSKAGAAANRHIFGALGLKVPKNKEEAEAISKDLMKGVKPLKSAASAVEVETPEEDPEAIDESWRKNISVYRAVETHPDHLAEKYSDPEFPFRQKSYISETSVLHPSKRLGKGKRKKNKQQEQKQYYGEEEPAANNGKQNAEGENPEEVDLEYYEDNEPNDQLMRDAQEGEEAAEAEVEDLVALPEDPSQLPSVDPATLQPGAVIAFKELTMSEATKWQPVISNWRTAVVLKTMPENNEVEIILALRDRENAKEYNEETGERIYGKFDMPHDEEEDVEDDGIRTKGCTEMMELRLVQAAPEDLEFEVLADAAGDEANDDNDKVTTEPTTSTATEETTTLNEEVPQPDARESNENEPVADQDRSQQQQKDLPNEPEKNTNQEPDRLAALDATLNAPAKDTHSDISMVNAPELETMNQDGYPAQEAPATEETFEEGLTEVAAAADHASANDKAAYQDAFLAKDAPTNGADEASEQSMVDDIAAIDRATAAYKATKAGANSSARAPTEAGDYSPKFHGLASFASNTTITPSLTLAQTSQVETVDETSVVSEPASADTSQMLDHGQRQPEESTPGDSTINAEFSQSIAADSFNLNRSDDDDEHIPTQRRSRTRQTQMDGPAHWEENNFPGTQFSAAMDISPISPPSRSRSINPIATPTSAQLPRQLTPTSASPELPRPSQAFKTKASDNSKGKQRAHDLDADELANTFNDESPASKSLPPPASQFASLKDRLTGSKKGEPRTKILAKRTTRRTKGLGASLPPAKEPTHEPVRDESPPPNADVEEESLFVSQSQSSSTYETRGTKKRRSMPAQHTEQSSPFKMPKGSQQIDLTLSDDEDLSGDIVHIPDADDVDDFESPGDAGWKGASGRRTSSGVSEGGKKKRHSTQATGRAIAHRKRAEQHNRRQTRG